jgi:hypothetical protein
VSGNEAAIDPQVTGAASADEPRISSGQGPVERPVIDAGHPDRVI